MTVFGINAKNQEQSDAIKLLMDSTTPLKILTGREGTGKTFVTAACILEMLLEQGRYKNLVLTRTTDEVGQSLGYLPGTLDEKFGAHLNSFNYAFSALMQGGITTLMGAGTKDMIQYMPIQFMRGISFPPGTIVWADEIAGLSPFELRMLCTRLGEESIMILTGSLEQIDRSTPVENTGLYKLLNSDKIKNSGLVGHIELVENQRSRLSNLISDVL